VSASEAIAIQTSLATAPSRARRRQRWTIARRAPRAVVGAALLVLVATLALLAPLIDRHDPNYGDFSQLLARPSADHPFGTDGFGRDVLARVLHGYRVSLVVAVGSVTVAVLAGLPLGLMAGSLNATVDNVIMRPLDLLMAFPPVLLAITLIAIFGTGTDVEVLALALIYVPIMARVLRGTVIAVRTEEYVEAARALGAGHARVMLRHILPNSLGPLSVQASISVGIAILIEAALSFIGVGTQPPDPSLGSMLAEGREFMREAPWVVTFPGLAIVVAVLGANLLGDGLRDAFGNPARH